MDFKLPANNGSIRNVWPEGNAKRESSEISCLQLRNTVLKSSEQRVDEDDVSDELYPGIPCYRRCVCWLNIRN